MHTPLATAPSSLSGIVDGYRGRKDEPTRPTPTAPAVPTVDGPTELAELLATVAQVSPGAVDAHAVLRQRARQLTARLAAAGHIPDHLVVTAADPLVVVARTLMVIASRS